MKTKSGKLTRFLTAISELKKDHGISLSRLIQLLEVSERSIYRYLEEFENAGLRIGRNHIDNYIILNSSDIDGQEAIFSIEEANLLLELVRSHEALGEESKRTLLPKIHLISEQFKITEVVFCSKYQKLSMDLFQAIQKKKQVYISYYPSDQSPALVERKIEPISLNRNRSFLLAFELGSKRTRYYALGAIGEVIISANKWRFEEEHSSHMIDCFNGLSDGSTRNKIHLQLSNKAVEKLKYEFPLAFVQTKRNNKTVFDLKADVYSLEEIEKFVLQNLGEVVVISPFQLIDRIEKKLNQFQKIVL